MPPPLSQFADHPRENVNFRWRRNLFLAPQFSAAKNRHAPCATAASKITLCFQNYALFSKLRYVLAGPENNALFWVGAPGIRLGSAELKSPIRSPAWTLAHCAKRHPAVMSATHLGRFGRELRHFAFGHRLRQPCAGNQWVSSIAKTLRIGVSAGSNPGGPTSVFATDLDDGVD